MTHTTYSYCITHSFKESDSVDHLKEIFNNIIFRFVDEIGTKEITICYGLEPSVDYLYAEIEAWDGKRRIHIMKLPFEPSSPMTHDYFNMEDVDWDEIYEMVKLARLLE